jgi:pyruvate/2-oxoglutarate dehydrogenase complex dihydrolipoamide dehydrogenase (E3) component
LRQHGVTIHLDVAKGGFAPVVSSAFESIVSNVFAVGDVLGYQGSEAAGQQGRAAGLAIAQGL